MCSSSSPAPNGPSEAPWSITQQAAMFCERAVNLLPPSARLAECQTHFSCLAFPFSQDCWCIEIIGLHSIQERCQCTFGTEISSVVPPFASDLPVTAHSSAFAQFPTRSRWVIIMTPASQYNDTTPMVHYLQWVSWSGALCIDHSSLLHCLWDLWIKPVQHGSHSKWQPQGAFIPPPEFNHFCLSTLCLSTELFRV